ncbi:MAG: HAD-IIA family hydrolase [Actinobacteria bacterium]|nr:MAG: HAD-IIA family hydrolase [Actinomycetota bacterium]TML00667.1 MAG: HAD-IIA family hydrolase [Actinomycetota bacterium]
MSGTILAQRYDALFLDLDGVLYRGDRAVPAAPRVVRDLRERHVRIVFLTNNSARMPEQVAEKLLGLGIEAEPEEVLTSALATAAMLRRGGRPGQTAFVIGERGVREALSQAGVELLDGEPERSDLVVVGWDRSADYAKLRTASLLVQRGARLIATNDDAAYPAPDGLWPGAGALLAAVITTTGASPTIVGKPARPLFEAAAEAVGAAHPLVVGDRIETDIAGASAMGWDSLLVLSGAADRPDLLTADVLPTYVAPDLTALLEDRRPARFRPAGEGDAAAVQRLLESSGLGPIPGAGGRTQTVVSTGPDGDVEATATLQDVDGDGLLRAVAVRQELRGAGLGVLAVAAAIQRGRERGITRVYLFTETAEAFFRRLGFEPIDRDRLPESVRMGPQAEECASAVAMAISLG